MEGDYLGHVLPLLRSHALATLRGHSQEVSPKIFSNLLFGLVTSVLVGNVFLPKGPIQGHFSFLWQAVAGISLFYLIGLVFLFFHVR